MDACSSTAEKGARPNTLWCSLFPGLALEAPSPTASESIPWGISTYELAFLRFSFVADRNHILPPAESHPVMSYFTLAESLQIMPWLQANMEEKEVTYTDKEVRHLKRRALPGWQSSAKVMRLSYCPSRRLGRFVYIVALLFEIQHPGISYVPSTRYVFSSFKQQPTQESVKSTSFSASIVITENSRVFVTFFD